MMFAPRTDSPAALPPSYPASTDQHDREAILAVHKRWWAANVGLIVEEMRECFPAGNAFSMFNRNDFTYFGIEELTALWHHYRASVPPRKTQTVAVMRLEVVGDVAWLMSELQYERSGAAPDNGHWEKSQDDSLVFGSKSTEIYHRDDGRGNPVWKMWHFHSSALQPVDQPRPAFDDTLNDRGLGGNPFGEPALHTVNLSAIPNG